MNAEIGEIGKLALRPLKYPYHQRHPQPPLDKHRRAASENKGALPLLAG